MKTLFGLLALAVPSFAALGDPSTFGEDDRFAWSANSGWIDFRADRPAAGDGVRVFDRFLSGYAWSANTGWVNFGDGTPANGVSYDNASGADFGVNQDGAGNLSGLAWSANSGWVNFGWATGTDANRPRFDLTTGAFSGYAWSANLGWINLGTGILGTVTVAVTDSDDDGISDAWERSRTKSLSVLSAASDFDQDGIPDQAEYQLDTNPTVADAPFAITRIEKLAGVNSVELEWPGSPLRVYDIEAKPEIGDANWIYLGTVPGMGGTNTVQAVEAGPPRAFFRINVRLPLQQ